LRFNRFYKVSGRVQTAIIVNKAFLEISLPEGHAACRFSAANHARESGFHSIPRT